MLIKGVTGNLMPLFLLNEYGNTGESDIKSLNTESVTVTLTAQSPVDEGAPTFDCKLLCLLLLNIPPIGNPALASLFATDPTAPVKKFDPWFKKFENDAIINIYCIS